MEHISVSVSPFRTNSARSVRGLTTRRGYGRPSAAIAQPPGADAARGGLSLLDPKRCGNPVRVVTLDVAAQSDHLAGDGQDLHLGDLAGIEER